MQIKIILSYVRKCSVAKWLVFNSDFRLLDFLENSQDLLRIC